MWWEKEDEEGVSFLSGEGRVEFSGWGIVGYGFCRVSFGMVVGVEGFVGWLGCMGFCGGLEGFCVLGFGGAVARSICLLDFATVRFCMPPCGSGFVLTTNGCKSAGIWLSERELQTVREAQNCAAD